MHRVFGRGAGLALAMAALVPAGAWAGVDTTGTPGLDPNPDSFFPKSGNGGYEVDHYDVTLNYDPKKNRFKHDTNTSVLATVTQPDGLSRFDLDFRGPEITELDVTNLDTIVGVPGTFKRKGQELIVQLDSVMSPGTHFKVDVDYRGRAPELTDPDGSFEGWSPTKDGAAVVGEPRGTPAWMPSNDHPRDKATFELEATVPDSHFVVSNGGFDGSASAAEPGRTTYFWIEPEPMATYLATATVGKFDVDDESLPGTPSYSLIAVDPKSERGAIDRTVEIVDFLENTLGTYPFAATGGIVDVAPRLGYSLETQTRPIYDSPPSDSLVAHELAHQWLGDNITLDDWSQIWLNEGFATWAQWSWAESQGDHTLTERLDSFCARSPSQKQFWNPPPANVPGPEVMFDGTIYSRGAATVESLRELIGDSDFSATLDDWLAQDPEGAYDTDDLIAIVKENTEVPDAEIDALFDDWTHDRGKPDGCSGAGKASLDAALGVQKLSGLR
jgi:aminopeptidase N